jgi:hypothetical protein
MFKPKTKEEPPVRRRLAERENNTSYSVSRTISETAKTQNQVSERQTAHKRQLRHKRVNGFLLFCLTSSLLAVLIISQLFFNAIYISFNEDTDQVIKSPDFTRLADLAKDYLNDHPLQRVSFLLDQNSLKQYIQTKMPEISDLRLQKANLFSSSLSISLRHPIARYGAEFVDASGVVFSNNFYKDPALNIVDNSGAAAGGLSGKFLSFVGQVIKELDKKVLVTDSVVVPSGAMRYVEFRLQGVPYPFKAQIDRDPVGQANDISRMKEYLTEKSITPGYVDVRVEGKGYYR